MRASRMAVVAVCVIGGGVVASPQSRAERINACANPRQGFYIHAVVNTAQCRPWEIPLSWSDDEPPDLTPLEDAIAQNVADIASLAGQISTIVSAIQVKAAGQPIGSFLGPTHPDQLEEAAGFLALSATDYVFSVDFGTGKLRDPSIFGIELYFARPVAPAKRMRLKPVHSLRRTGERSRRRTRWTRSPCTTCRAVLFSKASLWDRRCGRRGVLAPRPRIRDSSSWPSLTIRRPPEFRMRTSSRRSHSGTDQAWKAPCGA